MRIKIKRPQTIQETELRILVKEIPDLQLHYIELEVLPPGAPADYVYDRERPGLWPDEIPGKDPGKTEQFYCLVERPGHWERYLITQKGHLRVMSPYGCTRLCKDLGLTKLQLDLTNPREWPEDWYKPPRKLTDREKHDIEHHWDSQNDDEEV